MATCTFPRRRGGAVRGLLPPSLLPLHRHGERPSIGAGGARDGGPLSRPRQPLFITADPRESRSGSPLAGPRRLSAPRLPARRPAGSALLCLPGPQANPPRPSPSGLPFALSAPGTPGWRAARGGRLPLLAPAHPGVSPAPGYRILSLRAFPSPHPALLPSGLRFLLLPRGLRFFQLFAAVSLRVLRCAALFFSRLFTELRVC